MSPDSSLLTAGTTISSKQDSWIPSLDGIRALAFGVVFISHAGNNAHGMFGVTIFFFLSGFLITTLLRRENDRYGQVSLRGFYARRIARIFPPLYITLGFILVLSLSNLLVDSLDWNFFLSAATFTSNYFDIFSSHALAGKWGNNPGLGPFWSLAVEEHFYLFFPLIFLAMNRLRLTYKMQAAFLAAVCAMVLTWRCFLVFHFPSTSTLESHILMGTDARIDSILFGCILALAANPVLDKNIQPSNFVVVLSAAVLLVSLAVKNPLYRHTLHYTVQGLALMPLFMVAILKADKWFRWLNFRWITFVGTLSYTLYLVHRALLYVGFEHLRSRAAAIVAAAIGSVLYAYLMYRFVETPVRKLRQIIARRTAPKVLTNVSDS